MSKEDNLKPWKLGQSGNPKGRPKNRALEWIGLATTKRKAKKFYPLANQEVKTIDEFLLSATMAELKAVATHPDVPIVFRAYAIAIIQDGKAGVTKTIDKIRERVFGAVEQHLSVSLEKKISEMSDEELQAEMERLKGIIDNGGE